MQLLSLLQLESGRGLLAISQLQAALDRASKPQLQPQALEIGLLLANVLQRQGQGGQAEALLVRLASAFPKDQRPILAKALLLQERGDHAAAQAALAQAAGVASFNQRDQAYANGTKLAIEGRNAVASMRQEHNALLPIRDAAQALIATVEAEGRADEIVSADRKSTRLNSSHIPLSRMPSSA